MRGPPKTNVPSFILSVKPDAPSVPEPNITDDITYHVQEIIANLTNVLRHYAIEMTQRYQEKEMICT